MLDTNDYHFELAQGAAWSEEFVLANDDDTMTPVDLTGFLALSQVRSKPNATTILAAIDVAFNADRTSGAFTMSLTSDQTEKLPAPAVLWFDVKFTHATDATKNSVPIRGTITTKRAVSRLLGFGT